MSVNLQEQLSRADAEIILGKLPDRIRAALVARAVEIEYPVEAVVEMAIMLRIAGAIASFLDSEALGFVDCQPGRGQ